MTERSVHQIFKDVGAYLSDGHFRLSSGRHSSSYINKDMIFADTEELHGLADRIALRYRSHGLEVVLGPVVGGAILANAVAHRLSVRSGAKVRAVFADKSASGFVLKRGYDALVRGKKVLVVEDILTSGESAAKSVTVAREAGGEVLALAALCNRGGVSADDVGKVPELHALLWIDLQTWNADACPLCAAGVPLSAEFGHGAGKIADAEHCKLPRC